VNEKPVIGITMGDPAGVGPELCLRVLTAPTVLEYCTPVVFGSHPLLARVAETSGLEMPVEILPVEVWDGSVPSGAGVVLDCAGLDSATVRPGEVQRECGAAAYDYIRRAIGAARDGMTSAVVTAPVHKEALGLADIPYPGHTEMLAAHTATRDYCMMMASDEINVCLVTTHVALSAVPAGITENRIVKVIELAASAMRRMGRTERLTVCGLNPHAGEHGLFGDEEARVIEPAIERARSAGYTIDGPLPPDTAFIPAQREKTDAYIVMYHDQGLIPFKMLAFDVGVNVTLGLPIVRTSVDHGTAFDIAWQGKASPTSMVEAIKLAVRLAEA
jgi:4-phospho-D-threonate 3-dehydrogenase / 4-phospho-D-erythronate 3-dehydrogenase